MVARLGRSATELARPTLIGTRPRPAVLATDGFALFEGGEVEIGRATQWARESRYRKGEEPPFALGVQQRRPGRHPVSRPAAGQAEGTGLGRSRDGRHRCPGSPAQLAQWIADP